MSEKLATGVSVKMKSWKSTLDAMFSMDKLEQLSKQSEICRIAYFQLITGLNGVILTPKPNTLKGVWEIFPSEMPDTLDGKLQAISFIFTEISKELAQAFTATTIAKLITVDDVLSLVGKVAPAALGAK